MPALCLLWPVEADVDPKKSLSMFLAVADTEKHITYSQHRKDE